MPRATAAPPPLLALAVAAVRARRRGSEHAVGQPARGRAALRRAARPRGGRTPPTCSPSSAARRTRRVASPGCACSPRTSCPRSTSCSSRWKNDAGNTWLKIRVPMRPNGRTGWVRESALGALHTVHTRLVVNRHTLRVTLYDHGKQALQRADRRGQGLDADARRALLDPREVPRRGHDASTGRPRSGPAPTRRRCRTGPAAAWSACTAPTSPNLIPGRPSHGCIRLRNRDILRLYRLAPTGTPVDIL